MQIAKLRNIADNALLESSTIPESTLSEYSSSTTYALDDQVKVSFESDGTTPRYPVEEYTSLVASNVGNYPPDNPTKWQLDGASNRWKMFDGYVGTYSEAIEEIEVEIDSSRQNMVGLFGLQAKEVTFAQIVNTEFMTDYDCSSDSFTKETGWAYDLANTQYDCDGTQTASSKLYQTITLKTEIHYQVQFVVSNYLAGNIAGYVGGTAGTDVAANGTYTQIIAPGSTDSYAGVIADADFVGSIDSISVKKVPNTEIVNLEYYDSTIPSGWYYYFFYELSYLADIIWNFLDYSDSTLRVTITWKPSEYAKCGMLAIGQRQEIGKTQYEPTLGILDYSKKETNEFGYTYLKQGNFKKRAEVEAWLYNTQIDAVRRYLQSIRGIPIIVDANNEDQSNYESLVIYGFYRDFNIIIPGPSVSKINIEFEGLI
jgi:hypothetical protein